MMAAGKKATADGSVMIGRSADVIGGDDICQVRAIPRQKYDPGTTLTFPGVEETEIGLPPEINNIQPMNNSINIQFNPQLQVTILDPDADYVYGEIWTNASGNWDLVETKIIIDRNVVLNTSISHRCEKV